MDLEMIARVCHEANKAYCEAMGDTSQESWSAVPDWQKQSAIKAVEFHLSGIRTPQQAHSFWAEHRLADGWKYGPVKDTEKKEHPNLVPFEDLPDEEKLKDFLFRSIVNAFKQNGARKEGIFSLSERRKKERMA